MFYESHILIELAQFVDVQNCNSVQIVYSTFVVQNDELFNYFTTTLDYQLY